MVTIIGLLISLLLPAVQAAREAGRRAVCVNHVKQLVLAMHNYESAHQMLPINGALDQGANWGSACIGLSWIYEVLPFLEQQALYDTVQVGVAIDPTNTWVSQQPLEFLMCPSDTDNRRGLMNHPNKATAPRGSTNYKACCGSNWDYGGFVGVSSSRGRWAGHADGLNYGNGLLCRNAYANSRNCTRMEDITDGLANTFAVGEAVPPGPTGPGGSTTTAALPPAASR